MTLERLLMRYRSHLLISSIMLQVLCDTAFAAVKLQLRLGKKWQVYVIAHTDDFTAAA